MVTTEALRELHRIHRQLSDLRERLERGPKQVRARQANVANQEAALAKIKNDIKTSRMNADRKNVDLKSGEAKIKELEVKLNAANSNKEYQALKDQIAAAKMAGSVLSDEILEGFESIDQLEKLAADAQQKVNGSKDELAKAEQQIAASAESLQADVTRLERELKEAESALPADFKVDYDRIVRAKGEDALAQVDGDTCGGCFQSIRANQQNDLQMGRAVFCSSCGRLLYLPEGQTGRRKRQED